MKREGSSMKFPLSHPFPALENRTIPLFVKLASDWLKLSPGALLLVGSRRHFLGVLPIFPPYYQSVSRVYSSLARMYSSRVSLSRAHTYIDR